jgi:hypothetical protein
MPIKSELQIDKCSHSPEELLLLAYYLFGLLSDNEYRGTMFVKKGSKFLLEYMALHPRRQYYNYEDMYLTMNISGKFFI